jgi:hypothetical protein
MRPENPPRPPERCTGEKTVAVLSPPAAQWLTGAGVLRAACTLYRNWLDPAGAWNTGGGGVKGISAIRGTGAGEGYRDGEAEPGVWNAGEAPLPLLTCCLRGVRGGGIIIGTGASASLLLSSAEAPSACEDGEDIAGERGNSNCAMHTEQKSEGITVSHTQDCAISAGDRCTSTRRRSSSELWHSSSLHCRRRSL